MRFIDRWPRVRSLIVCSDRTCVLPAKSPEGQVTRLNGLWVRNLGCTLEPSREPQRLLRSFKIKVLRMGPGSSSFLKFPQVMIMCRQGRERLGQIISGKFIKIPTPRDRQKRTGAN